MHQALCCCQVLHIPLLQDLGLKIEESKKTQNPGSTSVKTNGMERPSPLLLKARRMGRQRLRSRNQEILNQISHNSCLFQGCNCRDQLRFIFRRFSPVPFFPVILIKLVPGIQKQVQLQDHASCVKDVIPSKDARAIKGRNDRCWRHFIIFYFITSN